MAEIRNRNMDAKLRRLVTAVLEKDDQKLKHDVARGFVASAETVTAERTVDTERVSKRVLVSLRSDEMPARLSNLSWINLVGNIHSVEVPVTRLEELAADSSVEYVEAGRDVIPSLVSSVPETRADVVHIQAGGGLNGSGVVVGIIDFGFDFTLDDFRNPDGSTRVEFIWDQSLQPQGTELSPPGFAYGVEYDQVAIDQALNSPDPFAIVRHRPEQGSHGTHVAGIATGNGRSGDANFPAGQSVGTAPGADIIFVQPAPTGQIGTFTDSARVAEAIAYIFRRAEQLGRPCVVNMSLGQNGGSHDGESIVERAIDRLLEVPGRAFVVAAGNEHPFRGHASGTLPLNQTRILRWLAGGRFMVAGGGVIQIDDSTSNEMEVWYSSRDSFKVRVTDPNDDSTPVVSPGNDTLHTLPSGDRVFVDSDRFTLLNGDAQIYVEVIPPQNGTLTTGVWQVELTAVESNNGRFDAWIERDARIPERGFADQSLFVGTDFDEVMTLGTPATTRRGVAVANYNHVIQAPSESSGRGGTRDGRSKPEVAAPGTEIVSSGALGGTNNPAFPSGPQLFPVRVTMSGTSMSAPHVSGIVALMLQKDAGLTAAQILKMLIASARPPIGVVPFDVAWGFGRVDAKAAVDLVD